MRKILLGVLFFLGSAYADPITGSIEIAKLTEMILLIQEEVESLNSMLENMEEMTDLQKKLTELEQLEFVKEISDTGQALSGLTGSLQQTSQLTQDIYGNVVGVNDQIDTVLDDIDTYAGGFTGYFTVQENGFGRVDEILADLNQISLHLSALDNQYWTGSPSLEASREPGINEVVGRTTAIGDDLKLTTELDNTTQAVAKKISEEGISSDEANRLVAEQLNIIALMLAQQAYRDMSEDSADLNDQAALERQHQDEKSFFRAMYVNPYFAEGEEE